MVAVVMHTEEKKDALSVEANITFMEELRDVTDVALEAEFMTIEVSTMNK
jgi:hypothetical protein